MNVAVGDVNGDGYDDLIVSQDAGGTTKVRVWSGATITSSPTTLVNALPPYQQFFANGLDSRDGIHLVVRDIDGDGKAEVITSPAGGTQSWLRVLSVSDTTVNPLAALQPFGRVGAAAWRLRGIIGPTNFLKIVFAKLPAGPSSGLWCFRDLLFDRSPPSVVGWRSWIFPYLREACER